MTKVTLNDLANLQNETTATNTINSNNAVIETAFENTLSRDGTQPNQMNASLDMNSNRILNLPEPLNGLEPFRLEDAQGLIVAANPSAVDGNAFATVFAVTLAVIPVSVSAIRVNAYSTAGDGGGGFYYRVASGTANPGKITSADGAHWQLQQYPVNVKALGAKGDGTTSDQDAINNASALAAQLGTGTYLPSGTYIVSPAQNTTAPGIPGATRYFALNMVSGAHFIGEKGFTTVKMANNSSTDSSPKDVNIFFVVAAISNITLEGIIFDLNGANNKISPNRALGPGNYNQYCCGVLNISGNDVNVNGLVIHDCEFNNGPGTNMIVTGQPVNGYAGIMSQNVHIYNNRFISNGQDTDDCSVMYGWAENVWVHDNYMVQPTPSTTDFNWVALEIHGKDTWFFNNSVNGFYRACWIASNFTRPVSNVHIHDNDFHVFAFGPSFYRQTLASLTGISNVHIHNNDIYIANTTLASSITIKAGVAMNVDFGVSDIQIHDNFIIAVGATFDSAGLSIGVGASNVIRNIFWTNNYVQNCVTGIYARVNAGDGVLDEIYDEGNIYLNLGASNPALPSTGSRFQTGAPTFIGTISCMNNKYIDKASDFDLGIWLIGDFDSIRVDNNTYESLNTYLSNSPYSIDSTLVTSVARRIGKQICTGSSAPSTGTWLFGEEFWNYTPTRTRNIAFWKYDGSNWIVGGGIGYGTGTERTNIGPALTTRDRSYSYFNTDSSKFDIWNGTTWLESL